MKTEIRIAIACFLGAALGALLALEFNYFWWAGILIGGVVGYLSFRFNEVVRAACRVWKSLPDASTATAAALHGTWNFVRVMGVVAGILCFAASIIVLIVGLAMSLLVGTEMSATWEGPVTAADELGIPQHYWIAGAAVLFLAGLILLGCILRARDKKAAFRAVFTCFLLTPLVLPFTVMVAVAWAIFPYLSKALARLGVLCLKTARQTFIMIHSEIRLLCMTDAMLGALAGYFCGYALIGGIVGVLCGLVNYKLVSVKWLKLVKA